MNLHTMNVDELIELRSKVNATLTDKLEELNKRIANKSETPVKRSLAGKKIPPKYRGPNGETWAGRGVRPRWMKGRNPDKFLIKK